MFFWNSLAFSMIQQMLAIWSLVPLPFLKPAWTSGSSWFMYCWSLAWRILSITLLACEMSNCAVVWAFFGVAFLWDWNENWPFPVLWPLLSFPNLLAYWGLSPLGAKGVLKLIGRKLAESNKSWPLQLTVQELPNPTKQFASPTLNMTLPALQK